MTASQGGADAVDDKVRAIAERVDGDADDIAERVTQWGWLAKGLVWVIIGILALRLAQQGSGGDQADQRGALARIADAPAGRLLVAVVGLGLVLFALWKLWEAVRGGDDDDGLVGLAQRIGYAGLGVIYGLLGATGVQIALSSNDPGSSSGSSGSGSGEGGPTSPSGIAEILLDLPAGPVLVFAVGAGTLAVAAYHLYKGLARDFFDDIDTADLDRWQRRGVAALAVPGFSARALVLGLAGWTFLVAAWQYDADEVAGLDDALRKLASAPAGRVLLGACAVGLVAAGLYEMVIAHRQRLVDDGGG